MKPFDRKEIKRKALEVLWNHYFILIVVMLVGGLLGSNASAFEKIVSFNFMYAFGESQAEVMEKIVDGDIDGAVETSSENYTDEANKEVSIGQVEAGRKKGVLADVINKFSSGSFLAAIASAIYSFFASPSMGRIAFLIIALTIIGLETIFLSEVFRVVTTRVLLEMRSYKKMTFNAFLFLIRTKRWVRVSLAYLRYNIFLLLWSLTIVGGLIKVYSYAMVRFILAENPMLTGKEAIELSKKMMKGHKWELFLFDMSFILWDILYILTGTVAGIIFIMPYKRVAKMEYYVDLRARCKEQGLEGMEVLHDDYLYEMAPTDKINEAYSDVIDIMNRPAVEIEQPSRMRAFFQNVFGIVWSYDKNEQEYRRDMSENIYIATYKKIVKGDSYPARLCPTPSHKSRIKLEHVYFMRHYSLTSLIMIFFFFCNVGWVWEVVLHIVNDGKFVNRGVLHGPWLPIYGTGAVVILVALNRLRRKPIVLFLSAMALSGAIEYFGSWALEKLFDGQKWWDYRGYFLNVNGRICAEGLLVFGIAGVVSVYFASPLLDNVFSRIKRKQAIWICATLTILFLADFIYSQIVPNTGAGITDYGEASVSVMEEQEICCSENDYIPVLHNYALESDK